jgi:hypothetical protein
MAEKKDSNPFNIFYVAALSVSTLVVLIYLFPIKSEISRENYIKINEMIQECPEIIPVVREAYQDDDIISMDEYENIRTEYNSLSLQRIQNEIQESIQ